MGSGAAGDAHWFILAKKWIISVLIILPNMTEKPNKKSHFIFLIFHKNIGIYEKWSFSDFLA
jgi:hypothetical protein